MGRGVLACFTSSNRFLRQLTVNNFSSGKEDLLLLSHLSEIPGVQSVSLCAHRGLHLLHVSAHAHVTRTQLGWGIGSDKLRGRRCEGDSISEGAAPQPLGSHWCSPTSYQAALGRLRLGGSSEHNSNSVYPASWPRINIQCSHIQLTISNSLGRQTLPLPPNCTQNNVESTKNREGQASLKQQENFTAPLNAITSFLHHTVNNYI